METLKYISVNDHLPDFDEKDPHTKRLLLFDPQYGEFLGWFDGSHFRTSYANIMTGITHFSYLPKRP